MTSRYDLMSPRRNGEKTFWTRVGTMFPAKSGDGFTIKLDALPLPDEKGEVWVKAFVPRDREDDTAGRAVDAARRSFGDGVAVSERNRPNGLPQRPSPSGASLDDEIPF